MIKQVVTNARFRTKDCKMNCYIQYLWAICAVEIRAEKRENICAFESGTLG